MVEVVLRPPFRWLVLGSCVLAAVLFGLAGLLAVVSPAGAGVLLVLGGLFMVVGVNAAEKHGAWLARGEAGR